MRNTKASYRLLRETMGFTHEFLADYFDINRRSEQRWEDTHYKQYPPERIMDELEKLYDEWEQMVQDSTEKLLNLATENKRDEVFLVIYRSNAEYHEAGGRTDRPYQWINSITREVARECRLSDLKVFALYSDELNGDLSSEAE